MKVLHTSDIHISDKNKHKIRLEALEYIVKLANEEDVDVVVIAGDMFDNNTAGDAVRPKIREIFENAKFTTLIIPGNHDASIFEEGFFWGNNIHVIYDYKKPYVIDNVVFWGFPYEDVGESDVLSRIFEINDMMDEAKTNILIYHGELADYSWTKGFGDEGNKSYMPIKSEFFKDTKIRYVLAGHFHTNFDAKKLPNGGWFIYPGSPVSITKKEIGQRKVNMFEVGNEPTEKILPTFHYKKLTLSLDPFGKEEPINVIDQAMSDYLRDPQPNYQIMLELTGYINSADGTSEWILKNHLDELYNNHSSLFCEPPNYSVKDISRILNHPLFSKFQEKLQDRGYDDEEKQRIVEYVIRAMTGAI